MSNDDNDGLWWLLIRWPSRNKFQNVVDRWSKQQKQQQQQLLCAWLFLCVVMAAAKKKKNYFIKIKQTTLISDVGWLMDDNDKRRRRWRLSNFYLYGVFLQKVKNHHHDQNEDLHVDRTIR